MQGILNFLEGIAQFFLIIINFIIELVGDIVYVIKLCGMFLTKVPDLMGWLPAGAIAIVIGLFSIVVVYKVLGREG